MSALKPAKPLAIMHSKTSHRREETLATYDHDIKLVMDRECQTIAEQVVHSHFPDHAVLGEEGTIEATHDFEWIIDPIDGTRQLHPGHPDLVLRNRRSA